MTDPEYKHGEHCAAHVARALVMEAERDELRKKHWALLKEWEALTNQNGLLKGKYDELRQEHGLLKEEHDELKDRYEHLMKEKEVLLAHNRELRRLTGEGGRLVSSVGDALRRALDGAEVWRYELEAYSKKWADTEKLPPVVSYGGAERPAEVVPLPGDAPPSVPQWALFSRPDGWKCYRECRRLQAALKAEPEKGLVHHSLCQPFVSTKLPPTASLAHPPARLGEGEIMEQWRKWHCPNWPHACAYC